MRIPLGSSGGAQTKETVCFCTSVTLKTGFFSGTAGAKKVTHSEQSNSTTQFPRLLLDFLFSSCESIRSMLFFHNPTSLWGFEVDGMAARAVAPPVEGHDDEAVLGEGRQSRHRAVAPVPGEHECVFVSVAFLRVHEAAQTPPAYLRRERDAEDIKLCAAYVCICVRER